MSEQNISQDKPSPQTLEALSDILLVLDKKKNRIEAVKGIDDEGNLETVEPKKSNLLDFMRVDKGDVIGNFFSNFWRRLKEPISFRFFRATEIDLDEVGRKLQKAIDNPTPEGNKLLDALEIKYENKLNQKNMETNQTSENGAQATESKPAYKYNVDQIDWTSLEKLNLNRELLEKNGQLDKLLKGYKTDGTYSIQGNFNGVVMKGDARLSLRKVKDLDKVEVLVHGVRVVPDLKGQFYGHVFTPEDRDNLKKTGNMGRVAELTNYSDGSKVKSLISIDKLTNEVVSFPVELIKISEKFGGVKLSPEQKAELLEGKPVLVEGMVNTKTGEVFNQELQYNADAKKLVFVGQSEGQKQTNGIPDKFRGKVFEEKDKKLLEDGEVIFMKGFITNDATKLYDGYVWQDKQTGKLEFDFDNPKKDKTQGQSETQKEGQAQSNKQDSVENTTTNKQNTRRNKLH